MKARYFGDHPIHGATFAIGAPISNTMIERYAMQRFFDSHELHCRGIDYFAAYSTRSQAQSLF